MTTEEFFDVSYFDRVPPCKMATYYATALRQPSNRYNNVLANETTIFPSANCYLQPIHKFIVIPDAPAVVAAPPPAVPSTRSVNNRVANSNATPSADDSTAGMTSGGVDSASDAAIGGKNNANTANNDPSASFAAPKSDWASAAEAIAAASVANFDNSPHSLSSCSTSAARRKHVYKASGVAKDEAVNAAASNFLAGEDGVTVVEDDDDSDAETEPAPAVLKNDEKKEKEEEQKSSAAAVADVKSPITGSDKSLKSSAVASPASASASMYSSAPSSPEAHPYICGNIFDACAFDNCPHTMVAHQAPVPSQFEGFWQTIFQYEVPLVIMLTKEVENGMFKADCYWPRELNQPCMYPNTKIIVEMVAERQLTAFEIVERVFRVSIYTTCGPIEHYCRQLHYLGWPDFGVPADELAVDYLVNECENTDPDSGPIYVHCSAGIGRTGTLMGLYYARHLLAVETVANLGGFASIAAGGGAASDLGGLTSAQLNVALGNTATIGEHTMKVLMADLDPAMLKEKGGSMNSTHGNPVLVAAASGAASKKKANPSASPVSSNSIGGTYAPAFSINGSPGSMCSSPSGFASSLRLAASPSNFSILNAKGLTIVNARKSVLDIVRRMKMTRTGMVQRPEQLAFMFKCLGLSSTTFAEDRYAAEEAERRRIKEEEEKKNSGKDLNTASAAAPPTPELFQPTPLISPSEKSSNSKK